MLSPSAGTSTLSASAHHGGTRLLLMVRATTIFLCCWVFTCQAAPWSAHTVARPDGTNIVYYLDRLKDANTPRPLLLILQGSDCNSVANLKTIREYAEVAPDSPVLYIEKYSITRELPHQNDENRTDCPSGYLKYNSIDQRTLDALQVLSELRRNAGWWNGELVIVGGSAGAIVGERLAPLARETRALIIFGFGARRMEDELITLIKNSLSQSDMDAVAQQAELSKIIKMIRAMKERPTLVDYSSGHSSVYWESLFRFDQLFALSNISVPILAVQGANDSNASTVPAKQLIDALKDQGKKNIAYREYEDLDHSFSDSHGVSRRDMVISEMRKWLSQAMGDAN